VAWQKFSREDRSEGEYLAWKGSNLNGFILNLPNPPKRNGGIFRNGEDRIRLHMAGCTKIKKARGEYTTGGFYKICGNSFVDVKAYCALHVKYEDGSIIDWNQAACSKCEPVWQYEQGSSLSDDQIFREMAKSDSKFAALGSDIAAIEAGAEEPSEKITLIKARLGQGKFRSDLDTIWQNTCAVTGCGIREVLRASHIKPWNQCSNKQERLTSDNGLLLAAHIDALFDEGLVSFDNLGSLLTSNKITKAECDRLGLAGGKLRKRPTPGQQRFLTFHREHLFKG
jgi:HNH endonuclease